MKLGIYIRHCNLQAGFECCLLEGSSLLASFGLFASECQAKYPFIVKKGLTDHHLMMK
jgi:hypothetical protein